MGDRDINTRQPPSLLYHYTTRERAEEVLVDFEDPGVYAEVSDGLYGPGFYALDRGPDEDRDRLRWECFEDSRTAHPMDGVLVLDPALSEPPFLFQAGLIWLLPVDPGSEGPPSIGHLILGVGIHEEDRGWEIVEF